MPFPPLAARVDHSAQVTTPAQALAHIWRTLGQPDEALSRVTLTGAEPALPSSFAVGTLAQSTIAAAALGAAHVDTLRTGRRQAVSVDMHHAALEFRSERYFRVNGELPPEPWDKIAGLYGCGDGRWVRLHTNFPHHRDGVLRLLGCTHDREAVARALAGWSALDFEDAAAAAGLVVTAARTLDEWDRHPQGEAVAGLPLVTLERIGDAPPEPLPPYSEGRPLSGARVLDLTRVIAGPVCGRTLAAHGADVLLVTAPHLPSIPPLVVDTGRGKRSAQLDLRDPADADRLRALLRETDLFVQGYRPGGLSALQFGPQQAAALRSGIVYVSLSAYGHAGPWAGRRGFDSLVQTASGFNWAEAEAAGEARPRPLPAQALDHAAGYLMAAGAMAALARRITVGGSWHVRVSLAQTAHWLRSLGRLDHGLDAVDPRYEDIGPWLETTPSGFGALTALRHAGQLSDTPPRWTLPAVPLGTHAAAWPSPR
ncbi:CoA transferase [Ralstonia solanacearum]|uniref:CoA transferase n=1 Tax=Ralstonia solanacearum TaxID=305 RepID=UPI00078EAF7A|nr:CoA transferase [Ralstonia solanacearum]AMP36078.1 carnitine dehydratase [Ralstonia solanacearum]AXV84872.1 carnitine dehydratase [Ralstonia solanacearum]AXW04424.1 carnitine dehydratase [Ralstonia solanacearum]AXW22176.1 carnitine dehydratase [Ralstonia solanacearum]AXW79073.1 carnitine dehydratase [Ralstonia solanacearum]